MLAALDNFLPDLLTQPTNVLSVNSDKALI